LLRDASKAHHKVSNGAGRLPTLRPAITNRGPIAIASKPEADPTLLHSGMSITTAMKVPLSCRTDFKSGRTESRACGGVIRGVGLARRQTTPVQAEFVTNL